MAKYRNELDKKAIESYNPDDVKGILDDVESEICLIVSDFESIVWEDVLDYESEFLMAIAKLKDLASDLY